MNQKYFVEAFYTRFDLFPMETGYYLSKELAINFAERLCNRDIYYQVTISFHSYGDKVKWFLSRDDKVSSTAINWVNYENIS